MHVTLYRKYRPKTFAELVGQNHIKITLESELKSGKLAHAYLFSGPRGLGKTTTARLLAKAVNCLNRKDGQSEPCNQCDPCLEVINNKSLDVIEIDAASHTGVDNVRENIIENARFAPTSRKFKVFIIDEVHMLSASAFNALLKTLEEPPAHVMFILATTEIHKVPETIISRCQHFDFRKVSNQEIISRLTRIISQEKKKVDKEVVESIAYYGQGCLRDAESLLGQVLSLGDKHITAEQAELVLPRSCFDSALELIDLLNKQDSAQSLLLVNNLVEEGVDLEKFTADLIEVARKILLLKVSASLAQFGGAINKDLEKKIADLAGQTNIKFMVKLIEVLLVKRQELRYAEISQLPLELGILELMDEDQDNNQSSGGTSRTGEVQVQKSKIINHKPEIKPVKQEVVEPVKETLVEKISIKLHQIQSKWPQVLDGIKNHNHSLSSSLKVSKPDKISDDGTLIIHCPNKFLQKRLMDSKNLKILEKVFEEIIGTKLIILVEVDEKLALVSDRDIGENNAETLGQVQDNKNKDKSIDNLLESFGGRVVE